MGAGAKGGRHAVSMSPSERIAKARGGEVSKSLQPFRRGSSNLSGSTAPQVVEEKFAIFARVDMGNQVGVKNQRGYSALKQPQPLPSAWKTRLYSDSVEIACVLKASYSISVGTLAW